MQIDPIKVREANQRMGMERSRIDKARNAAAALLWFDECAVDKGATSRRGQVRPEALTDGFAVVASGVSGAKEANEYVRKAAATFREAILSTAIEYAQYDFDQGEAK